MPGPPFQPAELSAWCLHDTVFTLPCLDGTAAWRGDGIVKLVWVAWVWGGKVPVSLSNFRTELNICFTHQASEQGSV